MAKRTITLPRTYQQALKMLEKAARTGDVLLIDILYRFLKEKAEKAIIRGFRLATDGRQSETEDVFEIGINCAGRLEGGSDYRRWVEVHRDSFPAEHPERAFANLKKALENLQTLDAEITEAEARWIAK